ncbi:unnamed protein product [Boreogadus saida]
MVVVAGSVREVPPAHVRYPYFSLSAHGVHARRRRGGSAWGPALAEVILLHELYTPPPLLIYNGGVGSRLARASARPGPEQSVEALDIVMQVLTRVVGTIGL